MASSDLQGAGRRDRRAARGEAAMSSTVVLAGCGNMGFAMLTGWLESGRLSAAEVWVVEPDAALRSRAAGLGVKAVADAGAIRAAAPRLIVLAVKPQVIPAGRRRLSALRRGRHDLPQHRRGHADGRPGERCLARCRWGALHAQYPGGDRQGHDGHGRQRPASRHGRRLHRRSAFGERRGDQGRRRAA